MKTTKEVYEAPRAEISVVQESDIITYSTPNTPWDSVNNVKLKYNF